MAGTAETRKVGGALQVQWPTEQTDPQSARTFDCDEQPAPRAGGWRSPPEGTDASKRNPGVRRGYPRVPATSGKSCQNGCQSTAATRYSRPVPLAHHAGKGLDLTEIPPSCSIKIWMSPIESLKP